MDEVHGACSMRRVALGLILVSLVSANGIAHAANGKHGSWNSVERLGAGVAVEVQSEGQAGVEDCRVARVDDTALTCEREKNPDADWDVGSGARLVFPRSAVRDVWVWEVAPNRHIGQWILLGVLGVGVALLVEGNIVYIAVYGVFLGTAEIMQMGPFRTPPRSPAPKRMRRRLVYRGATP